MLVSRELRIIGAMTKILNKLSRNTIESAYILPRLHYLMPYI